MYMPTTKKRLNITLPRDLEKALERFAVRDRVPQATKAAELIRLALTIEEDVAWNRLAKERDTEDAVFVSHDQAWL